MLSMPPNVEAVGGGRFDADKMPTTPDAATDVAAMVPVPVVSNEAPVPTCITALALVPEVTVLNAADPAVPPDVPQEN